MFLPYAVEDPQDVRFNTVMTFASTSKQAQVYQTGSPSQPEKNSHKSLQARRFLHQLVKRPILSIGNLNRLSKHVQQHRRILQSHTHPNLFWPNVELSRPIQFIPIDAHGIPQCDCQMRSEVRSLMDVQIIVKGDRWSHGVELDAEQAAVARMREVRCRLAEERFVVRESAVDSWVEDLLDAAIWVEGFALKELDQFFGIVVQDRGAGQVIATVPLELFGVSDVEVVVMLLFKQRLQFLISFRER